MTDDAADEPSELCESSDEEPQQGCRSHSDSLDVTDQCAMHLSSLLLKWQEGRQLPESTVNEIANDLLHFISDFQATLNTVEMGRLQHLGTKSGREQYWKSVFTFVSPQTVHLSNDPDEHFEYVPILETVQAVAGVEKLSGEFEQSTMLLRDVCDGSYFKEHRIFKDASSEKLLALQLYFDEFEVCNPLGSKRGKHKLLAGYLTILNRMPQSRSKLDDKYLILLAKTNLVTKFGFQKILEPLLNDVQQLETNGININGTVMKGSLLFVSGDNLSSHQLGGFRECFTSGLMCRYCMANRNEINDKCHEEEFVIRTKQSHTRHVELLKQDPTLSSVYGVNGESCLSSLDSFDVTQGLPPDVMHDLYEGVIPFVMKHVIRHIVSSGFLTLEQLNERLAKFPFQAGDKKSRLPLLSRAAVFGKTAIKGSAAENLCFFRFFSFLVGDKVPRENSAYQVYLELRAIVDIILAPQVSEGAAAYLKVCIEDFYKAFRETFSDVNIIPKMHYVIHYPRLLVSYGPLSKLSCMRFEAKHQFFKSVCRKVRNFRNITATLSRRHQMHFMYALTQPQEPLIVKGTKAVDPDMVPDLLRDRLQELCFDITDMQCVDSVTVSGRTLSVGAVVPLLVPDDDLPEFAMVTLIVVSQLKVFALASILDTKYFDEHFHAFVVESSTHNVIIENVHHCGEFYDLLHIYEVEGNKYVNPRYAFFTDSDV